MKSNQTRSTGLLMAAMLLCLGLAADGRAGEAGTTRWQEISAVQDRKTHLIARKHE